MRIYNVLHAWHQLPNGIFKRNTKGNCAKRVLKNGFIMAKIGIIGNGSMASSIVAKLQDTEQKIVVVKDEVNSILEQGTTPSKTQLRKCEKGLHEFKEKNKEWFCQHCGINMCNRG